MDEGIGEGWEGVEDGGCADGEAEDGSSGAWEWWKEGTGSYLDVQVDGAGKVVGRVHRGVVEVPMVLL